MGFDWRAFAEGFATTAAANIKEKKKEARKYREEQEQLAKDNIMKISRRNSVVNEVLGLTKLFRGSRCKHCTDASCNSKWSTSHTRLVY